MTMPDSPFATTPTQPPAHGLPPRGLMGTPSSSTTTGRFGRIGSRPGTPTSDSLTTRWEPPQPLDREEVTHGQLRRELARHPPVGLMPEPLMGGNGVVTGWKALGAESPSNALHRIGSCHPAAPAAREEPPLSELEQVQGAPTPAFSDKRLDSDPGTTQEERL
jgi:hypothetical protein